VVRFLAFPANCGLGWKWLPVTRSNTSSVIRYRNNHRLGATMTSDISLMKQPNRYCGSKHAGSVLINLLNSTRLSANINLGYNNIRYKDTETPTYWATMTKLRQSIHGCFHALPRTGKASYKRRHDIQHNNKKTRHSAQWQFKLMLSVFMLRVTNNTIILNVVAPLQTSHVKDNFLSTSNFVINSQTQQNLSILSGSWIYIQNEMLRKSVRLYFLMLVSPSSK